MASFKPPNIFSDSDRKMTHPRTVEWQGTRMSNGMPIDDFSDPPSDKEDEIGDRAAAPADGANKIDFNTLDRDEGNNVDTTSMSSTKKIFDVEDLALKIKGMYCILDLISEQGSSGLVDKIIITQESLERFINDVVPGAYTSMTKVDFKALDNIGIKPLGVYGSKAQIVELLYSIHAIDDTLVRLLLNATDDAPGPKLRPGLYFVRVSPVPNEVERVLVVFWPEDTTWDDGAISSVRRNRITFMRYLSKIADQTLCLVSEAHAKSIVWNDTVSVDVDDSEEDATMEEADDVASRLFMFEVSQTNEQEESVKTRPGIRMPVSDLGPQSLPPDFPLISDDLKAIIIPGETSQGILTTHFVPLKTTQELIRNDVVNKTVFRSILEGCTTLSLGNNITDAGIRVLAENGMDQVFPEELREWKERGAKIDAQVREQKNGQMLELEAKAESMKNELGASIREALLELVTDMYPMLNLSQLSSEYIPVVEPVPDGKRFAHFAKVYPSLRTRFEELLGYNTLNKLPGNFKAHKKSLIAIQVLLGIKGLSNDARRECMNTILADGDIKNANSSSKWKRRIGAFFAGKGQKPLADQITDQTEQRLKVTDDVAFVKSLGDLERKDSSLKSSISSAIKSAESQLTHMIQKNFEILLREADATQQKELQERIYEQCAANGDRLRQVSTWDFIRAVQSKANPSSSDILLIDNVELGHHGHAYGQSIRYRGQRQRSSDPVLEYKIQPITLTSDDLQNLRLDKNFIPTPKVESRAANVFQLPIYYTVQHIQLLKNEKCLLVVNTGTEFRVFCERPAALDNAIHQSNGKSLHQSKLGKDVVVAFDESTRTLAIVACEKLQLHTYSYDENFANLRAHEPVMLSQWYPSGTSIRLACFISGVDELLLADSLGQLRIFSQVVQQFRPATIELDRVPLKAMSSPDGSSLFLVFAECSGFSVHVYSWSTFRSDEGTVLDIGALPDIPVITSFDTGASTHLVWIEITTCSCRSFALDITKRATEFSFEAKGSRSSRDSKEHQSVHNALIDCHADVWTRFPVIPAISRQTLVTKDHRRISRLTFVTDLNQHRFKPYFAKMIHSFHQRTRKPTGDVLKALQIESVSFENILRKLMEESDWDISEFRAGEWLVDVLCLIPIQLAVARDNRFLPLKDGVSSSALEKSLLGANVSQIVDALSFGWYESIFQSYRATKPVKVVSSMGEQSVGKSFALNHLADTSFAGSAMRTTEGVWMSVTPTNSALIVTLDFEGVHSIERSLQEDTLLVLFNAALSNLILFRNNFALSRDIAGMFQSFQSSSTVLDPKANPTLFQSTLVIIIKDVVESDTNEIVKEFSLKFRKIVQDEQDANFISKLHAGRLDIIPWPVIESKQFYSLFPVLRARLDKQTVTHPTAGEFLKTLKTMMAKLKANDWGALSDTIAAHRASQLMETLPYALIYGYSDMDQEPLMNLDTNAIIEGSRTPGVFYISGASFSSEQALRELTASWDKFTERNFAENDRTWIEDLSRYLANLAGRRIEHVRQWIDSNLVRFKADHANIDALRRMMDNEVIDLKSHVELCKVKCESCNLLCIRGRRHNEKDAHDCATDHKCAHPCEFDDGHDEEDEEVPCGFAAGHTGKHICMVETHLCGEKCDLHGKKGCLEDCVKVVDHSDEGHFCASRTHACGEPCGLVHVNLPDGSIYSCPHTCHQPSDVPHSEHICDNRECPLQCQLCSRLCSKDHMHGLDANAVHLCGETHSCKADCAAQGICQIDTQPQSVLTTFTGQFGTFQYTKYSQVAKRLPCVFPIPPGCLDHVGAHSHSSAKDPFHYCESKCEDCGYYCTLLRGHTGQQHETRHGSMSRTRWTVDDANDAIELGGRKFGSGDNGAPMLCNLFCSDMGRHVHVDYCRAPLGQPCPRSEGTEHVTHRMYPEPDQRKDWVTHSLHWRRMDFKDPYSREHQTNFSKCDAMCSGPEHAATTANPAQPSYCTLPMFHPPASFDAGMGHISSDGHHFSCKNPVVLQQAFHVIFVIDRSASMYSRDRLPLPNTPATALISGKCDNCLGAVYSALYGFWTSRNAALAGSGVQVSRRDAYSIILFDDRVTTVLENDFTSNPDELLNAVLKFGPNGYTDYTKALNAARNIMTQHWSTERSPVIIFLSDGYGFVQDTVVDGLCREAVTQGKSLSFHSVSFGIQNDTLKRMAQIAREVQNRAVKDPLMPAAAYLESSYAEALDSVRLAETFLGFANSMKKTRGALLH